MSCHILGLEKSLQDYVVRYGARKPDALAKLRAESVALPPGIMQISADQGAFLAFLTRLMGVRTTLKVGVFTGYSSLAVASVLPEDGEIIASGVSVEWTGIARCYWQEAEVETRSISVLHQPLKPLMDCWQMDGRAHSTWRLSMRISGDLKTTTSVFCNSSDRAARPQMTRFRMTQPVCYRSSTGGDVETLE